MIEHANDMGILTHVVPIIVNRPQGYGLSTPYTPNFGRTQGQPLSVYFCVRSARILCDYNKKTFWHSSCLGFMVPIEIIG